MKMFKKKQTASQRIKSRARKGLNRKFSKERRSYVVDTSAIIHKFLTKLIYQGITGRIIIPNAVMAELENLANKGRSEGFLGLEEVAKLHKLKQGKNITIFFQGTRPNEMQIKFAKSGEIDSLIREIARKNRAILVTADLVQAKTAQAYGLEVLYFRPAVKEVKKPKRRFLFWKK